MKKRFTLFNVILSAIGLVACLLAWIGTAQVPLSKLLTFTGIGIGAYFIGQGYHWLAAMISLTPVLHNHFLRSNKQANLIKGLLLTICFAVFCYILYQFLALVIPAQWRSEVAEHVFRKLLHQILALALLTPVIAGITSIVPAKLTLSTGFYNNHDQREWVTVEPEQVIYVEQRLNAYRCYRPGDLVDLSFTRFYVLRLVDFGYKISNVPITDGLSQQTEGTLRIYLDRTALPDLIKPQILNNLLSFKRHTDGLDKPMTESALYLCIARYFHGDGMEDLIRERQQQFTNTLYPFLAKNGFGARRPFDVSRYALLLTEVLKMIDDLTKVFSPGLTKVVNDFVCKHQVKINLLQVQLWVSGYWLFNQEANERLSGITEQLRQNAHDPTTRQMLDAWLEMLQNPNTIQSRIDLISRFIYDDS